MKTLRNTSIIILAAAAFGFVNIFASIKVEKMKAARTTLKIASVSKELKLQSEQSLREMVSDVLSYATIYESGKVNIEFQVTPNKQLEILNVYGENPNLVSSVKHEIAKTFIIVPDAVVGMYKVAVLF